MITWSCLRRRARARRVDTAADERADAAVLRAADIATRGEVAAEALRGRLRRNHWGETVAAIARREG